MRRIVAVALLAASVCVACGDQTPPFCESLEASADMGALAEAIDTGNLDLAAAEAQRFADLADEAPSEIRGDFTEIADAVVDIVEMLGQDSQSSSAAALNARMADLDRRSVAVSDWALRECAIAFG